MNNTNIIKFTDEEMSEIKKLNTSYQDVIFQLGRLFIEKNELNNAQSKLLEKENQLKTNYYDLEKTEQSIMNNLVNKYGTGKLDIKNGTFTPDQSK